MRVLLLLSTVCLIQAQSIFDINSSFQSFFAPQQFGNIFTRVLECLSGVYFPKDGASAIAILKGSLNGNPVQGTVTFTQKVIHYSFFKDYFVYSKLEIFRFYVTTYSHYLSLIIYG